jgi:hypothetical protein
MDQIAGPSRRFTLSMCQVNWGYNGSARESLNWIARPRWRGGGGKVMSLRGIRWGVGEEKQGGRVGGG